MSGSAAGPLPSLPKGQVAGLHLSTGHRLPMRRVEVARAVLDRGLLGDAHASAGSPRQVLLMPAEVLEELGLTPGDVRENITTSGIDLMSLAAGQRLTVGEAELEVTGECLPCERMDEIRPGLQQEMQGRRGVVARVVGGGFVRLGDPVALLSAVAPSLILSPSKDEPTENVAAGP